MALFSIFKKNKPSPVAPETTLLGMVLLHNPDGLRMQDLLADLKQQFPQAEPETDLDKTAVLTIKGQMIGIGLMPVPIPGTEVAEAAAYNVFWANGAEEVAAHTGHVIVSLTGAKDPVKANILFTNILATILKHSDSLGVYLGSRTLLLSKDFFLANAEDMAPDDLPLYTWVYFGLRRGDEGKQSVYTFGLKDFGKLEMEIVNSSHSFEELMDMMYNLAHYVLASNVTLQHGETIGATADDKLKITLSKGVYLDGNTVKISY